MHAWACHHHIAIAPCLQNALAMEMPLVLASATEEEACWGYEMNPIRPSDQAKHHVKSRSTAKGSAFLGTRT
jgi:hypothetical protein